MGRPRPAVVFQLFLSSSRVQKKRAVLTIAAIAWSCLSLLLLLAFGEGLKRQMYRGTIGQGRNLAVIWPGETSRPWKGLPAGRPVRPRVEDIALLRERVAGVDAIVGELRHWSATMSHGDKTVTGRIVGTQPEYEELRNHFADVDGRFINYLDEQKKRRVVFLGNELAEDLFGKEKPVGKTLEIFNVPYTVIGVLKEKLQTSTYGGPDASHAVIPITTFRAQFGRDRLSTIVLRPQTPDLMPQAMSEVARTLGAKYGFDPEDRRALQVWNTIRSSATTLNLLIGVQAFLGVIGSLTLLIGGVGVANIMYAVVRERTREIGVKMALGARRTWITGPLILEGLIYTVMGGVVGVIVAVGVVTLLGMLPTEGNRALEFLGKPTLSPTIGFATAGILGVVGMLAGYFPARRAASIDPAETLRYE